MTTPNGIPAVEVLDTPSLGDRSYVVHGGGAATVVDPQRDIDRVLAVVEEQALRVTHVLETHVHNDYVTGGFELARRLSAAYVLPGSAQLAFDRMGVADGDTFRSGDLGWRVVHTPGHTPHHVSYVLAIDGAELAAFTGGSLLFGSVGRPDLVAPELTESLAHDQWRSVRRLAGELDPSTAIYPTHGFGSFCSATPTSGEASTLAEQRRSNAALKQDEDAFVRDLLTGLDAYPAYYRHMGRLNAAGPSAADLSPAPLVDADDIARRLAAGEWVVDLRARRVHAAGHVPGTLSFEGGGNAMTYVGWLIPWDTPVTLLDDDPQRLAAAQRDLARIGIDRPAAHSTEGVSSWAGDSPLEETPMTDFAGLAQAWREGADLAVLDLRRRNEWDDGHLDGARHLPLHDLPERLDDLPEQPLWVHCATGFRAAIGASMLRRAGHRAVIVDDDFGRAGRAGLPVTRAAVRKGV